jgi:hypothetical protein
MSDDALPECAITLGSDTRMLGALRHLLDRIDASIEAILDAHDFRFVHATTGPTGTSVVFAARDLDGEWHLSATLDPAGLLSVGMTGTSADGPQMTLTVPIAGSDKRLLAKAIGLAISVRRWTPCLADTPTGALPEIREGAS